MKFARNPDENCRWVLHLIFAPASARLSHHVPMAGIINLSAYKFAPLDDLPVLKRKLLGAATALQLKGTVLLSPEGINLFIAGAAAEAHAFIEQVRGIPGLGDITPKKTESSAQPFGRMRVRIKKEIIAFGIAGIDPARKP